MIKKNLKWLLPLLFIGMLAPFTPFLDLTLSDLCYTPGLGFYDNPFFLFLFHYGERFGFMVGGMALLFFLLSFLRPKWKRWRQSSCAIILTFVLGAGVLTNTLLKGYWGRPRPRQIEQFGGNHAYRPFWKPDFAQGGEPKKSFPSGHVAMGFYFLSVYLAGKRLNNRPLRILGIVLAVGLGGSLMAARVMQGAHFLSDVLISPILMWLVALAIDHFTWGAWGEKFLFLKSGDTSQEPDEPSMA